MSLASLSTEERERLGIPARGPVPRAVHAKALTLLKAYLPENIRMLQEIAADESEPAKVRASVLTYLVDRTMGRAPAAGEGKAPIEQHDPSAALEGVNAVAASLTASLPPEHARKAIQAIEAGLKATGQLEPGAKVELPPKPTPTPEQQQKTKDAARYIMEQQQRWEDGDG